MNTCRWLLAIQLTTGWIFPGYAASPEEATFAPNLEVVDIPTASTLYARMFHLNFRTYPETLRPSAGSGILLKGLASFNNSLSLGLALKASNVIGEGEADFDEQPVRAVAKLKLFTFPQGGLQAAVGYDGMNYDVTRQKGLYGVVSKDLTAGALFFRAHAGAGALFKNWDDYDPNEEDLNLFFGISAALSEDLMLGLEYDDVLYQDGSVNALVGYSWDVGLRLELDFKRLFHKSDEHYRVLKILYTF